MRMIYDIKQNYTEPLQEQVGAYTGGQRRGGGCGAVSPALASLASQEMKCHSLLQTWPSTSLCPCSNGITVGGTVRDRGCGTLVYTELHTWQTLVKFLFSLTFHLINRLTPILYRVCLPPPSFLYLLPSPLPSPYPLLPPTSPSPSQFNPRDGGWVCQVLPLRRWLQGHLRLHHQTGRSHSCYRRGTAGGLLLLLLLLLETVNTTTTHTYIN